MWLVDHMGCQASTLHVVLSLWGLDRPLCIVPTVLRKLAHWLDQVGVQVLDEKTESKELEFAPPGICSCVGFLLGFADLSCLVVQPASAL